MKQSPRIFKDINDWAEFRRELFREGKSVGFVPTMGALHEGHSSLLSRCRNENDYAILSIYVNPTQFDNKSDLERYPITLDHDVETAETQGVDAILLPKYPQIYPDQYRYKVSENTLSQQLCGQHRPGHFDGVLTVVMKLLNIVRPTRAYFGEKDFQQLQLVRGMVEAFYMDVEIVSCPTVREKDGLAMSSRNLNLSPQARALAPYFAKALRESRTTIDAKERLISKGFEVDYVEDVANRRFGAVKIGGVRLIDNVET